MFLRIFLCSSVIAVASANNVIPAQTYPIYQQNGYMNPQANLPSNIQSYLQSGTAQNQLQQLNITPSSIKQALLNRLLTGQSRQTISNPNAKNYSPNLNGVQNNHIPANLANNYIVVPRDYLKNYTSYSNIDTNTNRNNTKKVKQSKRRSKLRRKSDAEKIDSSQNQNNTVQLNSSTKNTKTIESITENNKSSRKNSRKQNSQAIETTAKNKNNTENENSTNNHRPRRRKKKQKEEVTTTTESPIIEQNKSQNTKSPKRRKKQKEKENSEPESQIVTKSKPKEIENVDLDITNEGMNNESRLTRNPKQETNDLLKSIPNTPKEITNHFLTNLSQFSNPLMGNWFTNYENLFQSLANQSTVSQPNENKPKRRRKSKRTKKSKRKNVQNRNVTESTNKVNSVGIDSTTTERSITINERTQTNFNSNLPQDAPKSFENRDLSSNEIFRDGYNINDFEDRYNTGYYEGYIDDYYPLFTDSAAYNANNKEIILKNLNDNKYYYATDIIDADLKNNHDTERTHMFNAYERNKHTYDEIEKESIRNAYKKEFDDKIEEKLQFRSPPHLESPDFKTRQIDKSKLKPEVYYVYANDYNIPIEDKSSSYSTAKTPYSSGAKRNEIKMQPKDVETVYAKSKVVSYGPVFTAAEDSPLVATNQISWSDYNVL